MTNEEILRELAAAVKYTFHRTPVDDWDSVVRAVLAKLAELPMSTEMYSAGYVAYKDRQAKLEYHGTPHTPLEDAFRAQLLCLVRSGG